jgi:hypothetical protein
MDFFLQHCTKVDIINEANSQLENMFEVLVIEETDSCSASS